MRQAAPGWSALGWSRAAPEVFRVGERLADQSRAEHLAVFLDQAAIGLVLERHLADAGDEQRIGEAVEDGHDQQHADALENHASLSRTRIRSISLRPMNGPITPPTP